MKRKLQKNELVFSHPEGSCKLGTGTFYDEFSIEEARKCSNLWKEERYRDLILNKAYILYATYVRKGTRLIGQGEPIGLLSFFSGKAYRGMGALGCSRNRRTTGVGISTQENLLLEVLKEKGLDKKIKTIRNRDLTANNYKLVMKVNQTVYSPDSEYENTIFKLASIGLLGEDNSYIDLNSEWSSCLTENLKV